MQSEGELVVLRVACAVLVEFEFCGSLGFMQNAVCHNVVPYCCTEYSCYLLSKGMLLLSRPHARCRPGSMQPGRTVSHGTDHNYKSAGRMS